VSVFKELGHTCSLEITLVMIPDKPCNETWAWHWWEQFYRAL